MSETRVEQLMRDAKILQIYAETDEIQIVVIKAYLYAPPLDLVGLASYYPVG